MLRGFKIRANVFTQRSLTERRTEVPLPLSSDRAVNFGRGLMFVARRFVNVSLRAVRTADPTFWSQERKPSHQTVLFTRECTTCTHDEVGLCSGLTVSRVNLI